MDYSTSVIFLFFIGWYYYPFLQFRVQCEISQKCQVKTQYIIVPYRLSVQYLV